jgi:hypothetical protein
MGGKPPAAHTFTSSVQTTRGRITPRFVDRLRTLPDKSRTFVPLSYRLGRRLVARIDHPLGGALFKLHGSARFAQAQAGALWGAVQGHGALLAACTVQFAVATRWQPGRVLTLRDDPADFAAAGKALAAVHGASHAPPFTRPRMQEIEALERTLADAADLLPEAGPRLAALARRLTDALAATPAGPGPINGDFSADQVVMANGAACLMDLDLAARGTGTSIRGTCSRT